MTDFGAIRDRLWEAARRRQLSVNALHHRFEQEVSDDRPPASRQKFYDWFQPTDEAGNVGPQILACVPILARILGVPEFELYQIGGLLPEEAAMSMALATAAREIRESVGLANQALAGAALSTAGEALVVDRILRQGLDYRVEVWPVVRGEENPLHLKSWIILKPVERVPEKRRQISAAIQGLDPDHQRERIRREIVTESLWRALGLRWRTPAPIEWVQEVDEVEVHALSGYSHEPLILEIPVEERNRQSPPRPRSGGRWPEMPVQRILVLGGLWSHVEPLSALLAEALDWGRYDLRYQGVDDSDQPRLLSRFCKEKLADPSPRYVWGLAESADFMMRITNDIIRASATHIIVHVCLGDRATELAARAWQLEPEQIRRSAVQVERIVEQVNRKVAVIRVNLADEDLVSPGSEMLDRNRLLDHVWYSSADVLNLLLENMSGPPIAEWGDSFAKLRLTTSRMAMIPRRKSIVSWLDRTA